jgi:hypothetical protein
MSKFEQLYLETLESYNIAPNNFDETIDTWDNFIKTFELSLDDLDDFTFFLGFSFFEDLQHTISPRDLYKSNEKTFLSALNEVSDMANTMSDEEIINSLTVLWKI